MAEHRVPLDGTTWSVWRDVVLRSAGFPAEMVLAIRDEPLAHAADLDGAAADGPAYDAVYAEATTRLTRAIAGIHADQVFQEAVIWQNPGLAQRLQEAGPGPKRRSKDRQRELVIANYLQRYCLKNDTIGFFGPVGWAAVDPGTKGLVVTPGERLLARRTTYFEVWAIDKVAAAIARQGRALGWLRPRRTQSAFLDGNVLRRVLQPPVALTDTELRILMACDGSRTLGDVLVSADGTDVRIVLSRLAELGALRMDLESPMHAWPERLLREQLEQIADPAARTAALEPLERIVEARDAVAGTAGDPDGLRLALAGLAATFEKVTGSSATRRAGELYAGRTLVYQDAVRDVRVELGAAVMAALAGPLGLVLDSARWLMNDIADRYRALFSELFDREVKRTSGAPVPLQRLVTLASPYLFAQHTRSLGEIAEPSVDELQRRWGELLGPLSSGSRHQVSMDAIAAKAAGLFPGRRVAWSGARQHSPDLMIAAASPAELERGNFLLVLGELHLANNTLDGRCFVEQHPDPASLIAAEQADHGARRIVSIPAKDFPSVTSRTSPPSALMGPGQVYWSSAPAGSLDPPEPATVMPAAAMTVARRGGDLVVHVMPSGTELDFFEVIGDLMGGVVTNAFHPLPAAAHRPRITIDRLVLSREQWVFQVADSGWAFAKDEQERYQLARRWRREKGLPEQVFFRVPVEYKPMAADFRSIVLVNLFAKYIRQTQAGGYEQYTVSEMLPDMDQLWLTDKAGRRYCSELRFVAYDHMSDD